MIGHRTLCAWRFWLVNAGSGALVSPLSGLGGGVAAVFPGSIVTPASMANAGSAPAADAGRLFASLDAHSVIASMLVAPAVEPAALAYGEVQLTGDVIEHEGRRRLVGEVSTSGTLRILSLSLSEALPRAARRRVQLRYRGVEFLAPWPRQWWDNARSSRERLAQRVRGRAFITGPTLATEETIA